MADRPCVLVGNRGGVQGPNMMSSRCVTCSQKIRVSLWLIDSPIEELADPVHAPFFLLIPYNTTPKTLSHDLTSCNLCLPFRGSNNFKLDWRLSISDRHFQVSCGELTACREL